MDGLWKYHTSGGLYHALNAGPGPGSYIDNNIYTFVGLNVCSFRRSAAIFENFILRKFRPDGQQVCSYITNCENRNIRIAKSRNLQKLKHIRVVADNPPKLVRAEKS